MVFRAKASVEDMAYEVIGDCYIEGIMDGNAMEHFIQEQREAETIYLC
jgi:hypothetical protein